METLKLCEAFSYLRARKAQIGQNQVNFIVFNDKSSFKAEFVTKIISQWAVDNGIYMYSQSSLESIGV
jgi:hypothetical protein